MGGYVGVPPGRLVADRAHLLRGVLQATERIRGRGHTPGSEDLDGVGTGPETLPHRPSQIVDAVDDLPGMVAENLDGQMAGARIGMPSGLAEARTGEEVAGTVDDPLVDGHPEADVAARHVSYGGEPAA